MIIARAPLRISFAGGGTDLPAFYEPYGPGVVVSTAIDRYVYVTLMEKFGGGVSVRYRNHEHVEQTSELQHILIRKILMNYGIMDGVELVIISEVPARGSGLGASSALAVALCACLDTYTENPLLGMGDIGKYRAGLAERAALIEIEGCGSPIGKQDHYASAMGGINKFTFSKDLVEIEEFHAGDFLNELQEQSLLFYLNIEHEYEKGQGNFVQRILKDQKASIASHRKIYELQRDNARDLWSHMKYEVIERFMDHVNENWRLKRMFHKDITNPEIDRVIQIAYQHGATATKVCGAGGGGFLYVLCPPDMQEELRENLHGYPELKFRFNQKGAEIIFNENRNHQHSHR